MNLVFLTKFYPYGTGEAFIENEIEIISRHYDKILIIACEAPAHSQIVRTLPPNVSAEKINGTGLIGKGLDVIVGLGYLLRNQLYMKEERKKCPEIMQKLFLGYFEAKCNRIYQKIEGQNSLKEFVMEPFMIYSYWLFMTARVGLLINEKYKASYRITRAHRYDLYEDKNHVNYLPFRKMFLEQYDRILPCSANGMEHLLRAYPEYKEKIQVGLLGTIDYGVGKASSDGTFRMVSCSRISGVKRVHRIIEALELLDDKGINIHWTHIGGGKGLDKLKNMAHQKLKNMEFAFLGDVKNQDVLAYYKEHDVDLFINVSSSEGLPVSIMEAISYGIPVLATDVGGTSEVVMEPVTGKLVKSNFTNQELAEDIQMFITAFSNNELCNYRKQCREFWKENFMAVSNYEILHSTCCNLKLENIGSPDLTD